MADAVLIFTVLITGICGYWVMDRVDRYLNKYVIGEETEDGQEKERAD